MLNFLYRTSLASLSLSLSISIYLSLSLSLSLSLLSLSLSIYLYLSIYLSHSRSRSLCTTLSLSLCTLLSLFMAALTMLSTRGSSEPICGTVVFSVAQPGAQCVPPRHGEQPSQFVESGKLACAFGRWSCYRWSFISSPFVVCGLFATACTFSAVGRESERERKRESASDRDRASDSKATLIGPADCRADCTAHRGHLRDTLH
jgi:hypothetical protein